MIEFTIRLNDENEVYRLLEQLDAGGSELVYVEEDNDARDMLVEIEEQVEEQWREQREKSK